MPTQRTAELTLNSVVYALRIDANNVRQFKLDRAALDPSTNQPFIITLPFGGAGMGPTLGGGTNQFNYGYDTTAEIQGQLGPGPKVNTLTLTSAGTVTKLYTCRDASGNMYLYVVNDSAILFKVKMSDLTTIYTKTFSHAASPNLTDLAVIKDGEAPGVSSRGITQPTGAFIMAFFGETAPINYTETVAIAGVDSFVGVGGNAYGGVAGVMPGSTNTETWVFKSTGASGQATGAFSRVQYAVATTTSIDFSNASSSIWLPATPWQAGDFGSSITSIIEYQRGPLVSKPEGVYLFDQQGNSTALATFRSYVHADNGKHTAAWGHRLIVPTRFDLVDVTGGGAIGMKTLPGNTSPLAGMYPTAQVVYGDDLFAALYDGTDTYIIRLRPRRGENSPNSFLLFPVTRFTGAVCRALKVVTNVAGITYLIGGKGTNLFYIVLDPVASRRYEDAGIFETAVWGDPAKPFQLDRLTVFGSGVAAGKSWQVAANINEGGYNNVGGAITTVGPNDLTFTPGTNDSGTLLQLRFTATNGTSTNQPLLKGGNPDRSGAGVTVKGQYLGQRITRYMFTVNLPSVSGGMLSADETTQIANLKALENTVVALTYADYGISAKKVLVEQITITEGGASAAQATERFGTVVCRELVGS